jgi:uncharacterized protein
VATKRVAVSNETRGSTLGALELRDSYLGRLRGLLGRRSLPAGDGIIISPCSSVHMFFMLMSLDIVYLDRDHHAVRTVSRLRPFCLSAGGRGAHITLELPPGTIAATGTAPGDQLRFDE